VSECVVSMRVSECEHECVGVSMSMSVCEHV
jgi:hypothetical protein